VPQNVNTQEPFRIQFHAEAAARFSELAQNVLNSVKSFGNAVPPTAARTEIHPVARITPDQILGEIKVTESAFNGMGQEKGRYWTSNGLRVGWEGTEFDAIKDLALRFANAAPIKGMVSDRFLLDEVFKWLQETLEGKRRCALPEYVAGRCTTEIREYEIWVPVYRTYLAANFEIGEVQFRTVSKELLDDWYSNVPSDEISKPEVAVGIDRKRARIQASIAACVRAKAEVQRARELAQSAASDAVGLLRFLSPVNWTCRLVSHCLPVGCENTRHAMELFVEDGKIKQMAEASVEEGPSGWNVDEARHMSPGLLEALHHLALHRHDTDFKSELYGALQLHSRQSVATDILHKIALVAAAIESLLLRDVHEPIQKNLGERMAFVIGNSLEERKAVVKNVEEFYRIRSSFFHHGQSVSPDETDIVDKFFFNVWFCLGRLLLQVDQYESKAKLLAALEERKLS
jgi:hypothetical protein